jgi:hypothetical protein
VAYLQQLTEVKATMLHKEKPRLYARCLILNYATYRAEVYWTFGEVGQAGSVNFGQQALSLLSVLLMFHTLSKINKLTNILVYTTVE